MIGWGIQFNLSYPTAPNIIIFIIIIIIIIITIIIKIIIIIIITIIITVDITFDQDILISIKLIFVTLHGETGLMNFHQKGEKKSRSRRVKKNFTPWIQIFTPCSLQFKIISLLTC